MIGIHTKKYQSSRLLEISCNGQKLNNMMIHLFYGNDPLKKIVSFVLEYPTENILECLDGNNLVGIISLRI